MKYCAAYYSDIGIQKETNQDSLLLVQRGQTQDDEAVLAVICDGVGGLKMGERSSAAVVTAFRDWFDERVEELYEQEEPETELFDDWDNLIQSLHIRLKDNSEKAGFRSGTTVEAVLFMKGRYYICHVGDCRTYIISDPKRLSSPMVLSFPRKTVYILTPMVIPTQCLVAATGALPVSVTSSMESAICSLHSICKF